MMEESDFDPSIEGAWVGDSVSEYDDRFAQTREAVCHHTPSREVILLEGSVFERTIARLHTEMAKARARGNEEKVAKLEKDLDLAVEAWAEWSANDAAERSGEEASGIGMAGYISITDLITRDLDSGAELDERERELRAQTLRAVFLFVCQDNFRNLELTFKNFLSAVRIFAPEILDEAGVTQADLARVTGETRAAVSAREMKLEKFLRIRGVRSFLMGGKKGLETRERNREAAKGNKNRKKGRDRKW